MLKPIIVDKELLNALARGKKTSKENGLDVFSARESAEIRRDMIYESVDISSQGT